jgi:DNA-binding YbaB/EbfC family protein
MDFMKMMKQVQDLQSKAQAVQQELDSTSLEGVAGGGMVRVTLSGKGDLRAIKIDPTLMKPGEGEIVEDLIIAAHQDARGKVEALMKEKMQSVTGGLPLPPGLKLF